MDLIKFVFFLVETKTTSIKCRKITDFFMLKLTLLNTKFEGSKVEIGMKCISNILSTEKCLL